MNPGETLPMVEDREGGLGRALHDRLAQLAARLERLTVEASPNGPQEARAALDARLDAFAAEQRAPSSSRGAVTFAADAASADGRTMEAIAEALRDLGEPGPVEGLPAYRPAQEPAPYTPPGSRLELDLPGDDNDIVRPTAEDRLRTIRDRIEQLKTRHGPAETAEATAAAPRPAFAPPLVAPAAPAAEDFSEITAHLHEPPPEAFPAPPPPAPVAVINLNQAIAEIAARQRMIDDPSPPTTTAAPRFDRRASPPLQSPDRPMPVGSRPPPRAAAPVVPPPTAPASRPPAPAAIDGLTAEVAALRQDMTVLTRFVEAGVSNDTAVVELGREVQAIRALLDSTALGTTLASLEAGYGRIVERLDSIDRKAGSAEEMQAIVQEFLHRMPAGERFDALAAEFDRLAERVASGDHRAELMRIEARLAAIDGRVATGLAAPAPAVGFVPSTIAATSRLEADVAATRRAVEALGEKLDAGGGPALVRIEQRLAEMSARLESALSEAPKADSVSDLFERLDRLASRGEAAPAAIEALAREIAGLRERERTELASLDRNIAALAERLDAAVSTRGPSPDVDARLDELNNRLVALSVGEPSPERLQKIEEVEAQVAMLSGRLENLSGAVPDALAQLEGQMSALVSRIDAEPQRADAIREVEAHLARLEGTVEDTRRQSSVAMQDAAREAIRELSGMSGLRESEGAIVEALKADLGQLQAAVQNTSRRSADGIDEVHGTLDKVVERLSRLEAETRAESTRGLAIPPMPAAAAPAVAARSEPVAAAVEETPGMTAAQRLRGLGPIDEARDRPIEPGAWRPVAEPEAPKSERDRKADFIAAARRAAQAAAAEHASMRPLAGDVSKTEAGPRTPSRLGAAVAANRRAIILAAAAIVLTIAVVTVLKPFSGSGTAEPDPAPAEPVAAANATVVPTPNPAAIADAPVLAAAGPVEATALQPPTGNLSNFAAAAGPLAGGPGDIAPVAAADAVPVAAAELVEPMPPEAVGSVRLRQAAAEGDTAALYEVGARYAEGRGVDRDTAKAALWFERAAERGLAVAQYRLGTMYEGGVGVEESRTEAQAWYLAAAQLGNVQSMHNLGVLLSQGIAGTPDFVGAIEWFTAAAEHGVRDSQYNLGVIYARGIGVTQDLVLSYQWFAAAAAQGDLDAGGRRDEVAAALDADQLAAARAAVSAWVVTPPDPAANAVPVPEGGWDSAGTLDTQTLVRTIQAALNARGFDAGPADGAMGPRTRDAIRAFQATIGTMATGEIDPMVLSALGVRA